MPLKALMEAVKSGRHSTKKHVWPVWQCLLWSLEDFGYCYYLIDIQFRRN